MPDLGSISWSDLVSLVYGGYVLVMIALGLYILMENRNPSSTIAYLLTLIFLPVIGVVIYLMFGQNYRKKRIFSRKLVRDNMLVTQWEQQNMRELKRLGEQGLFDLHPLLRISKMMVNTSSAVLTKKNEVEVLTNGNEAFPAFLEAMKNARHHIHIDMYILEEDNIGHTIIQLLINKAREGVEVRLSYDAVGSRLSKKNIRQLKQNGVPVYPFMPVRSPALTSKINYRNHRKIIVVDGEIGFVGGMNLADRYTNTGKEKSFWRDTHARIRGEAVWSLQLQFMLTWRFVSGEELLGDTAYFPQIEEEGNHLVQIVESGPDTPWSNIMKGIFMAIANAREYVLIQTPYFIPNEEVLRAIESAALSGVMVKIMIPAKGDSRIAQAASYSYIRPMLEAGAEVYLYQLGMLHAKTLVIDGAMCCIGTANMDYRSFDLNFEINAFIYDVNISERLTKDFENDLEHCRQLDLTRWNKRRLRRRFSESLARIFAPLL